MTKRHYFNIYYFSKGKTHCDWTNAPDYDNAISSFEMAHMNEKVILINIEEVNA